MTAKKHIIVGTGPAGVAAAEGMRNANFPGEIYLIGEEPHLPYERPPLSKGILKGAVDPKELSLKPETWFSDNRVELLSGDRVEKLDLRFGRVEFASGSTVSFDKALIATGGAPRTIPGINHERLFLLRTLADAMRLEDALTGADHIVVVGGGFIGCEVAATARERGISVTIIEPQIGPMALALGPDISAKFHRMHRDEGVQFILNDGIAAIEDINGAALVRTQNGQRLECDAVLLCVGLVPRTELLAGGPISLDDGIKVDLRCQTSVAEVFAAGDVARFHHPLINQQIRIEHHDNALSQGACAGRNMVEPANDFTDVPWVWSDQYGQNLQITGFPKLADETVMRGDIESGSFCKLFMKNKRLIGAIGLNRGRDISGVRRLISRGVSVESTVLVDETIPIKRAVLADASRKER